MMSEYPKSLGVRRRKPLDGLLPMLGSVPHPIPSLLRFITLSREAAAPCGFRTWRRMRPARGGGGRAERGREGGRPPGAEGAGLRTPPPFTPLHHDPPSPPAPQPFAPKHHQPRPP